MYWLRIIYPQIMDEIKDGDGGGAGAAEKSAAELKAANDTIAALKAENEKLKGTTTNPDPSLSDKVKKDQEEKEKGRADVRRLESAVKFNMSSADFLKQHADLLPKDAADIFSMADKETYESSIEKSRATKAALVQSFFSQQENVDLLTDSQKVQLADYLKLTKNGKDEKAESVYENLFEPTLEGIKRSKKAAEVARSRDGFGNENDADKAYREKLIAASERHFMGKK